MKTKERIFNFIKKEIVLSVAIILAIITCFFVPIDKRIYRIFRLWYTCMVVLYVSSSSWS